MINPEMRDNRPVWWTWVRMRSKTELWWMIRAGEMYERPRAYEYIGNLN